MPLWRLDVHSSEIQLIRTRHDRQITRICCEHFTKTMNSSHAQQAILGGQNPNTASLTPNLVAIGSRARHFQLFGRSAGWGPVQDRAVIATGSPCPSGCAA